MGALGGGMMMAQVNPVASQFTSSDFNILATAQPDITLEIGTVDHYNEMNGTEDLGFAADWQPCSIIKGCGEAIKQACRPAHG